MQGKSLAIERVPKKAAEAGYVAAFTTLYNQKKTAAQLLIVRIYEALEDVPFRYNLQVKLDLVDIF